MNKCIALLGSPAMLSRVNDATVIGRRHPPPVRLVATDLDGTLLRPDGTTSPYTRAVLRRVAEGLPIVLVTARPPRRAKVIANELGVQGAVICCNGALVYDTLADEVVAHSPIPAAAARNLIESLRAALPGICFAFELETRHACEPEYRVLAVREGMIPDEDGSLGDALALCVAPVTKLIARHPGHVAATLAAALPATVGDGFTSTYSGATFVEISAPMVDKASALATICADRGIERAAVLAFGDMRNDLPMLRWAGRAIAVANAHPDVLAEVADVTESNADDGVARALERLLLSKR
jgi:Cof subfamily protein (haloacid dehalogenase superfamily)